MTAQELISSTVLPFHVNMKDMETTGERIIFIRKGIGHSQAEFAERIGVTRGAVGNWERDKGITQKNLEKICRTFGCSLDWLLTGQGTPFPDNEQAIDRNRMKPGKKLDRTLFQMAHDMARNFEQTQLGGLADFEDFTFLVEKYYDELLIRKSQFENSSEEEH